MFTKRNSTELIVIHTADTYARMDIGVKEIDRWHRDRGFFKIGYHLVIRRDGTLEQGRNIEECGAHVKGHNYHSVGVCMVGGRSDDDKPVANYTPEQWAKLEEVVRDLSKKYPDAKIVGHRDLDRYKACPCFDVQSWWNKLN